MPHRVAGLALAAGLVVDPAARHRALEIDGAPVRARRSQHDAAVPRVLRDECERVERLVVGVAVLDQLERRQARGHPVGHGRARPRSAARRQIVAGAHGHLELDAQVVIGGDIDARRRRVHELREDGAGGRLLHTGHLLHRPGREGDLPAGDLPSPRLRQEAMQRVLDLIGVIERRRAERGVERAVAGAGPMHLERGAGGGGDRVGRQHAPTLA